MEIFLLTEALKQRLLLKEVYRGLLKENRTMTLGESSGLNMDNDYRQVH